METREEKIIVEMLINKTKVLNLINNERKSGDTGADLCIKSRIDVTKGLLLALKNINTTDRCYSFRDNGDLCNKPFDFGYYNKNGVWMSLIEE